MDDTAGLNVMPFKSRFTVRPLIQLFSTYYAPDTVCQVPATALDERQSPQPHRTDTLVGRDLRESQGPIVLSVMKGTMGAR